MFGDPEGYGLHPVLGLVVLKDCSKSCFAEVFVEYLDGAAAAALFQKLGNVHDLVNGGHDHRDHEGDIVILVRPL